MTLAPARWLIDACLPCESYSEIDAAHSNDFLSDLELPGLIQAWKLNRTLVTCGREFRGLFPLDLYHPGLVIFEEIPISAAEVERNLKHFEFRIGQYEGKLELTGNRFVIRADKEILMIEPAGHEVSLEPWKEIHVIKAHAHAV